MQWCVMVGWAAPGASRAPLALPSALPDLLAAFCCSLVHLVSRCFLEELMRRDLSCKFCSVILGRDKTSE